MVRDSRYAYTNLYQYTIFLEELGYFYEQEDVFPREIVLTFFKKKLFKAYLNAEFFLEFFFFNKVSNDTENNKYSVFRRSLESSFIHDVLQITIVYYIDKYFFRFFLRTMFQIRYPKSFTHFSSLLRANIFQWVPVKSKYKLALDKLEFDILL